MDRSQDKESEEQLKLTKAQMRASEENLEFLGMSEAQIQEVARTRQIASDIELRSPAAGLVLARNAFPGLRFERGGELFRIADLYHIWILADVFENDALLVRAARSAAVRYQGKTIPVRMSKALPQFDAASRALKVRLEMDNPNFLLRPDMFVDVEFQVTLPPGVAVPVDAVLDSGVRKTVFVEAGDGYFEPRLVETGWCTGDLIQITKGIEPGERVVVSGNFLLDSESRMKLTARGAAAAAGKDPVCGMDAGPAKAAVSSAYRGKTYYFCSKGCKEKFDRVPEQYLASAAGRAPRRVSAMIDWIVEFSVRNRFIVFTLVAAATLGGWWSIEHVALDAIPDLSDTQVIVYSRWDRSPDIVESQVTYPIVSALLGAPRVKAVRGFSDFSYSYVYAIFEDGTDIYRARSRTLEYLSGVLSRLPEGVKTELGPDATGVGWVFQYVLVDRTGEHSLADLRSYQDWYLRYYLKAVPGVAEVAPLGGFGPVGPYPPLDRQSPLHAGGSRCHGGARHFPFPVAYSERADPGDHHSGGGADFLSAVPGHGSYGQYHVAGRFRDRHRSAGGCGHRGGRTNAQEARGMATQRVQRGLPHRRDRSGEGSGRPQFLRPAGDRGFISPGADAGGAGRPAVQTTGLYEDPGHDCGRRARHHARPGVAPAIHAHAQFRFPAALVVPDGERGAGGADSSGGMPSRQPCSDTALRAGRLLVPAPEVGRHLGRGRHGADRDSRLLPVGIGVHAASG